jgi:hypothetical protein
MSHLTFDENKYRALNRENDYRPYLIGEDISPAGYRFGRFRGGRVRASVRGATRSIVRVFKVMHEALLAFRIRHAESELRLQPHRARDLAIRRGIGR